MLIAIISLSIVLIISNLIWWLLYRDQKKQYHKYLYKFSVTFDILWHYYREYGEMCYTNLKDNLISLSNMKKIQDDTAYKAIEEKIIKKKSL